MYSLKESNDIFQDISLCRSVESNDRYFYSVMGVNGEISEYLNQLFLLGKKLENEFPYVFFNKIIPMGDVSKTISAVREYFKFKDLSQKCFIPEKCIKECGALEKVSQDMSKNIKKEFTNIVNEWYNDTKSKKNITFDMIVNFCVKLSSWASNYVPVLFKKELDIIPKVMCYGCEKEHELYFLKFLFGLGCDIIYINTNGLNNVKLKSMSKVTEYNNRVLLPEFPKKEIIVAYETNAVKAQKEVEELYYDINSLKPWQLRAMVSKNIPIKTTYDELFSILTVEANIRPSFKVIGNTVYVPNICCKISGVENDRKAYSNKLKTLAEEKNVLVYFESISLGNKSNMLKKPAYNQLYSLISPDRTIKKDNLLSSQFYKYNFLNYDLQNNLISAINDYVSEMLEKNAKRDDVTTALASILTLDKGILNLLQNFDYGFNIPKIILFHNTDTILSLEDKHILKFLNRIGLDILVITPTGYADVEETFDRNVLNTFQLEENSTDFQNPFARKTKGLLGKFFNI